MLISSIQTYIATKTFDLEDDLIKSICFSRIMKSVETIYDISNFFH